MADFPGASWPELLVSFAIHCLGQSHIAFQLKRDRLEDAESEPGDEDKTFARAMDQKFLGDRFAFRHRRLEPCVANGSHGSEADIQIGGSIT